MARAFTAADVTHHNEGTASASATPGVAFARGAVKDRAGLIVLASQTTLLSPYQWHPAAASGITAATNNLRILCRADLPEDDQSWLFVAGSSPIPEGDTGAVAYWAWIAEEWTNISSAPALASAATTNLTGGLTSISTGTTDVWTAPYAVGIAAAALLGSASSAGWPTSASWSNGFIETDVLSVGAGTAATDLQLRVARLYGTLDDPGPWETTCTFTGSMTGLIPFAALAVFRAELYDTDV